MQNFVRFHSVESEIKLATRILGRTIIAAPPTQHAISNDIYFIYKFLCNFIPQKPRSTYPQNFLKRKTTAPPVKQFYQKLMDINIHLNNFKYKISLKSVNQFLSYIQMSQNFCHKHTQADIFQKQSNHVQDIPKRVNPSKIGNRKFARNNTFFCLYLKKLILI